MEQTKREEALYEIRKGMKEFISSIKDYEIQEPIVEVGKMVKEGKVYEEFPEFYVDTKEFLKGKKVVQLDIDENTHPDICDNILNLEQHFKANEVGTVILMHVLEHVTEFWKVPEILVKILRPGGLVFIQTPWNFRFHGPRPDCWRISDDGYEALFSKYFHIKSLDKVNPCNDYLHPLLINVVLEKK